MHFNIKLQGKGLEAGKGRTSAMQIKYQLSTFSLLVARVSYVQT